VKRAALVCFSLMIGWSGAFALSASDQEARDAALSWTAMVDAAHYGKAYLARAPRVNMGVTEERFIEAMHARRYPFGRALSRQFLKVIHTHQILGSPDGDYQLIGFKSSFEHKAKAGEMVVVTKETGHWQVSGYRIY
jgi:Protein of unknown function (DUF4019)